MLIIIMSQLMICSFFFFFNDTATTEIYTLSLHDALPISANESAQDKTPKHLDCLNELIVTHAAGCALLKQDRKSTRLNSSHSQISYAVFCLKKKKLMNSPTSDAMREPDSVAHSTRVHALS